MARKGTKRARRSGRKGTRRQRGGVLKGIFNACGLGYVYNATLGKCMRKRGNNNNNKNKNKKPTLPHNNEVPAAASTRRRRGRAGSFNAPQHRAPKYNGLRPLTEEEEKREKNEINRYEQYLEGERMKNPEYAARKFQQGLINEEAAKQKATANVIRNVVKRQEAADKAARREHARRVAEAKAILAAEPPELTPAEQAERRRWWGIQEAAYKRVMDERQGRKY